jgi:hypothetical protein
MIILLTVVALVSKPNHSHTQAHMLQMIDYVLRQLRSYLVVIRDLSLVYGTFSIPRLLFMAFRHTECKYPSQHLLSREWP